MLEQEYVNNQRLYKFLIITNEFIEAVMLEETVIEGDTNQYYKNSIYSLKSEYMHDELRFMRFQYPNGGSYHWAYVIIDSNSVAEISQHKWGLCINILLLTMDKKSRILI